MIRKTGAPVFSTPTPAGVAPAPEAAKDPQVTRTAEAADPASEAPESSEATAAFTADKSAVVRRLLGV